MVINIEYICLCAILEHPIAWYRKEQFGALHFVELLYSGLGHCREQVLFTSNGTLTRWYLISFS